MSDSSVRTIIEPLSQATAERRLKWEEDPTGGVLVRLGPNTINIYEIGEHDDDERLVIRIINKDGKVVDFANSDDLLPHESGELRQMFIMARRSALRVDEVVGDILMHLSTNS